MWEVPLNLVMLGVVACPDISVGPSTCPVPSFPQSNPFPLLYPSSSFWRESR